jgi:hypothetical protein
MISHIDLNICINRSFERTFNHLKVINKIQTFILLIKRFPDSNPFIKMRDILQSWDYSFGFALNLFILSIIGLICH